MGSIFIFRDDKFPILDFPLIKFDKSDILNGISNYLGSEAIKSCITCENPPLVNNEYIHCGTCLTCIELMKVRETTKIPFANLSGEKEIEKEEVKEKISKSKKK